MSKDQSDRRFGARERFTPLRRPSKARKIAVLTLGPVAWLAAIVVVGAVVDRTDAIGMGLVLTAATCACAFLGFLPLRWGRVRRER